MLSSLHVKNFRSILELRLDFSYGEGKAPNGHQGHEVLPFIEAENKDRMTPCMAFFGANASGKTNVLMAIGMLKRLVQGERPERPLAELFEPNLINRKFAETTFDLEFVLSGDRFTYRIIYSATAIGEESLSKNGKVVFGIRQLEADFAAPILSTSYPKEKLADILRVECSDGDGRQIKPFLNCIGLGYPGLHADLKAAFEYFRRHLIYLPNEESVLLPTSVAVLASLPGSDEGSALGEITDIVRRLDIDITAIDIVQREAGGNEAERLGDVVRINPQTGVRNRVQITAVHQDAAGNPVALDFYRHESAGTQRLAGLVGFILYALKTGGVILVDELEGSLHPLLMREIVLLFKKRRRNPKGAQIIFTTHNTDILDDSILRVSEIALVRKTAANGTLVRRLVDAKKDGEDIRNVTNFRKQYLAGFYSGVPHPAL
jgi:hypothetical protein